MKRLLIGALLVVLGSMLLNSCTSVPRDNTNSATTSTSSSRTYSK
jgi:starvation-inducible outer membrane lipoprotein